MCSYDIIDFGNEVIMITKEYVLFAEILLCVGILTVLFYKIVLWCESWLRRIRIFGFDWRIGRFARKSPKLTPKQFQQLRASTKKNFSGIYILYNQNKRMYYVGQAVKVLDRVNRHFTGKGNGDVYADYKYGDRFVIRMIPLQGSGFRTLNDLERYAISWYDAYEHGYNKTRGNK